MKKGYKSLVSLCLAVIMLLAVCVPAFASVQEKAEVYSSNEFITSIETSFKGKTFKDGDIVTITAKVKNCATAPRDIMVKVRTSAFARILTINGEKNWNRNVTFKDVQPDESKYITVEFRVHRIKTGLGLFDNPLNTMLGDVTMVLFGFVDTLSLNLVTSSIRFDEDSYASICFNAKDVTPVE